MTTRIEIDLNVRVRGNGTRAGFEDVDGPVWVGMDVEVFEPESGVAGPGRVTEIDAAKRLVFLAVEWSQLQETPAEASQQQRATTSLLSSVTESVGRWCSAASSLGQIALQTQRPTVVRYGPQSAATVLVREAGRMSSDTELVVAAQ